MYRLCYGMYRLYYGIFWAQIYSNSCSSPKSESGFVFSKNFSPQNDFTFSRYHIARVEFMLGKRISIYQEKILSTFNKICLIDLINNAKSVASCTNLMMI